MNKLSSRVEKLESTHGEDIHVLICSWDAPGEYIGVKCAGGQIIERKKGETEEDFIHRAHLDAKEIAIAEGRKSPFVVSGIRGNDADWE